MKGLSLTHEVPLKITENSKELVLEARFSLLAVICFILTGFMGILLQYMTTKTPEVPMPVWLGISAMALLCCYAGIDNLRIGKTLRIQKLSKTFTYTYHRKGKTEAIKGRLAELEGPIIVPTEDEGTTYFHLDLIVPEAPMGRFRLSTSYQESKTQEAQKLWLKRLGKSAESLQRSQNPS